MPKSFTKEELEKMKSEPLLSDFWKYCIDHPGERFWQALGNWSGHPFIYVSNVELTIIETIPEANTYFEDTFYWDTKNNLNKK